MIYKEHEDEGSAILESSTEQNKPIITASYSLANNSYQTQIIAPDTSVEETVSNNIIPPSNLTNNDRRSERIGEALLTSLGVNKLLNTFLGDHHNLGATKANCLSIFLLGATLVISVLNTLLLSFVVKSIQLNDRGFISGKINWDNHLDSTILDLPTKVAGGKSISLKSVESYTDDKPLNLEKLLDSGGGYSFTNLKQDQSVQSRVPFSAIQNKFSESVGEVESVFLSNAILSKGQKAIDEVALSNFNYLSINLNYHNVKEGDKFAHNVEKPETLRIRTNLMVLNQIIEKQASPIDLSKKSSPSTFSSPYQFNAMPDHIDYDDDGDDADDNSEQKLEQSSKITDENIKQLLILNGGRKSVTLPSENQLNLASPTSGSIILDEQLRSSEITGSLKEDLNIQTRDGNLVCKSRDSLRLMSRSAGIKMATFEELTLKAPSLSLKSANNLYIQNGLEYFDSTQLFERDNQSNGDSNGNKVGSGYGNKYNHDKDEERINNNNILTQSADVERNHHQSHRFSANGNEGNNYDLRAYNLVVADRILIAVA